MVSVWHCVYFLPRVFKTAHLWLHSHRISQIWLWFHGLLLIVPSEVMFFLTFGCVLGEFLAFIFTQALPFSSLCGFQTQSLYSSSSSTHVLHRCICELNKATETNDGLVSGRTGENSSWKKDQKLKDNIFMKRKLIFFFTPASFQPLLLWVENRCET